MSECEHGSDPTICPPCQGASRHTSAPLELGPVITADYAGVCPGCDEAIRVGDRIRRVGDTWRHNDNYCMKG